MGKGTMRRTIVTVIALGIAAVARATDIVPTSLDRQVQQATTIAFGRVEQVTIHDRNGRVLSDLAASTGPGESNELRLHVVLDINRALKGVIPKSKARVILPVWKGWHSTLRSARDAYEKRDFIFFLSPDLSPSLEAEFIHFDFEKDEIIRVIEKTKPPNKAPEPTTTAVTPRASAGVAPAAVAAHL